MAKITKVSIYDMDGTIVCSLHRYRTIVDDSGERIDLDYWRENEYRAMDDSLLPLAAQYRADLKDENTFVIIATARVLREADNEFIKNILGEPDYIISRCDGDTTSGGKLKIAGLAKFFNLKNFRDAEFTFYEDNTTYLKAVCDRFNIRGVYVPSKQGH
jgi:phosphoglycolate phosphatase-like HAD superfamily hydrolase